MIYILITSHGGVAGGMMQPVRMLVGEQEHLDYITFDEEMGSNELDESCGEKITSVPPDNQYLVLCGIKGRTPFNVASRYSFKSEDVAIIYRMDFPTSIEATVQCRDPGTKLKDLAECLQQQSGFIIGLNEPQDRTWEAKVQFLGAYDEPLH